MRNKRIPGANDRPAFFWSRLPISLRAILTGLLVALIPANVWPIFLLRLSLPAAVICEVIFLGLYVWWSAGGGRPRSSQASRGASFRRGRLSSRQWSLAIVAVIVFAVTIHASIVLLFRLVPFPIESFRRGYDLSFIHSLAGKWVGVVVSAMSAGVCEETGFRGYMQQPIEQRNGALTAILVSSFFFTILHLTKGWAVAGMVPIVFGAGILLGLLAWASRSLVPSMIGHVVMDIGLFAYWWTGIAGDFTARPITETGIDRVFLLTCVVFAAFLVVELFAITRLRRTARPAG